MTGHVRRAVMHYAIAATASLVVLLAAASGARAQVTLTVTAGAGEHPISPDIYGVDSGTADVNDPAGFWPAGAAADRAIQAPLDRWGGDVSDTYNFLLGSSNSSADYFYENFADCWDPFYGYCWTGPANPAGGGAHSVFLYRDLVAKDRSIGARTIFTLPMMGMVAKDAPSNQPNQSCGFPRSQFPHQDQFDRYDTGCGDGVKHGTQLPGVPSNDGTPIGAAYAGAFVTDLVQRYGTAAAGGVGFYELGNEPDLWASTHADMHPAAQTEGELWSKSLAWALAIKQADPSAKVIGPSFAGWFGYLCSEADNGTPRGCSPTAPDRAAHGNLPQVAWLLSQWRAYDQAHGTHLLDYLDLHYYPSKATTAADTRSLWDPHYKDPGVGTVVDLIPRMRGWVGRYHPGIGTSLSEYDMSICPPGSDPCGQGYRPSRAAAILNALIEADTLGIFAREGLDLATFWPQALDGGLIEDAFLMYRNYDGHGSGFGDSWVPAASSDQATLAVYAARRSSDNRYTVIVINKTAGAVAARLRLRGRAAGGAAQRWQWTGGRIGRIGDVRARGGTIQATYPARSMTLFVL